MIKNNPSYYHGRNYYQSSGGAENSYDRGYPGHTDNDSSGKKLPSFASFLAKHLE